MSHRRELTRYDDLPGGETRRHSRERHRSRERDRDPHDRDRDHHRERDRARGRGDDRDCSWRRDDGRERRDGRDRHGHRDGDRRGQSPDRRDAGSRRDHRSRGPEPRPRNPCRHLVLEDVPSSTTDQEITNVLAYVPGIVPTGLRIPRHRDGSLQGPIVVEFETVEQATTCREEHVSGAAPLAYDNKLCTVEFAPESVVDGPGPSRRTRESKDWQCSTCQSMNFARRVECFGCHAPRPRPGDHDAADEDETPLLLSGLGSERPSCRLRFFQLDPHVDENVISAWLVDFAPAVRDIRIIRERGTGQPRGFAFVEFASVSDAAKCLAQMNGRAVHGNSRPLRMHFGRSREEEEMERRARVADRGAGSNGDEALGRASGREEPGADVAGATEAEADTGPAAMGMTFDAATGYWYDPRSGYYFDSASGMYFDMDAGKWMTFDASEATYRYVEADGTKGEVVKPKASSGGVALGAVVAAPDDGGSKGGGDGGGQGGSGERERGDGGGLVADDGRREHGARDRGQGRERERDGERVDDGRRRDRDGHGRGRDRRGSWEGERERGRDRRGGEEEDRNRGSRESGRRRGRERHGWGGDDDDGRRADPEPAWQPPPHVLEGTSAWEGGVAVPVSVPLPTATPAPGAASGRPLAPSSDPVALIEDAVRADAAEAPREEVLPGLASVLGVAGADAWGSKPKKVKVQRKLPPASESGPAAVADAAVPAAAAAEAAVEEMPPPPPRPPAGDQARGGMVRMGKVRGEGSLIDKALALKGRAGKGQGQGEGNAAGGVVRMGRIRS